MELGTKVWVFGKWKSEGFMEKGEIVEIKKDGYWRLPDNHVTIKLQNKDFHWYHILVVDIDNIKMVDGKYLYFSNDVGYDFLIHYYENWDGK